MDRVAIFVQLSGAIFVKHIQSSCEQLDVWKCKYSQDNMLEIRLYRNDGGASVMVKAYLHDFSSIVLICKGVLVLMLPHMSGRFRLHVC